MRIEIDSNEYELKYTFSSFQYLQESLNLTSYNRVWIALLMYLSEPDTSKIPHIVNAGLLETDIGIEKIKKWLDGLGNEFIQKFREITAFALDGVYDIVFPKDGKEIAGAVEKWLAEEQEKKKKKVMDILKPKKEN